MELKYDNEILDIQWRMDDETISMKLINLDNNTQEEVDKAWYWWLNTRLPKFQQRINYLKKLQKPVKVNLVSLN